MISAEELLRGKTAAIFDFDGTIGDTIGLWNEVDVRLAAELGFEGSDPKEFHAFREETLKRFKDSDNPYRDYCGEFGKRIGSPLSAEEIHAKRYRISRRMLKEDVKLREGVAATLLKLKSLGLRMAVATTTRRGNIDIYCNTNERIRSELHLAEVFEGFVTAEDVERIKPDPQCYLKALELLGVRPEEAFAVEDTVAGAQAAAAAGLACIGIYEPHSAPYTDELKARTAIFFEDYAAFLLWLGVEPVFCAAKPS